MAADRFSRWLADRWERVRTPRLDWVQVEVTSRCNARCSYCPRTVCRSAWADRDLPPETFRKLLPTFTQTGHVHLQGWGEPFLHKHLFQMISLAKETGCRVGTTTNGMLLRREALEGVLDSGLDMIAFSLAGTGEENDVVRKGTSLRRVLQAIDELDELKRTRGAVTPSVHIAYLLLRSGLDAVSSLHRVLEGHNIRQVVISTLDFVAGPHLAGETLRPESEAEYAALSSRLQDVVAALGSRGMEGHFRIVSPHRRREVCTENVRQSLFVSSDGSVSPCVYLNVPADCAEGSEGHEMVTCSRRTFGNVSRQPLSSIWAAHGYDRFRRSFDSDALSAFCRACPKLYEV